MGRASGITAAAMSRRDMAANFDAVFGPGRTPNSTSVAERWRTEAAIFLDDAGVVSEKTYGEMFDRIPRPALAALHDVQEFAERAGRRHAVCDLALAAAEQNNIQITIPDDWGDMSVRKITTAFLSAAAAIVCYDLLELWTAQELYGPWKAAVAGEFPDGWERSR